MIRLNLNIRKRTQLFHFFEGKWVDLHRSSNSQQNLKKWEKKGQKSMRMLLFLWMMSWICRFLHIWHHRKGRLVCILLIKMPWKNSNWKIKLKTNNQKWSTHLRMRGQESHLSPLTQALKIQNDRSPRPKFSHLLLTNIIQTK